MEFLIEFIDHFKIKLIPFIYINIKFVNMYILDAKKMNMINFYFLINRFIYKKIFVFFFFNSFKKNCPDRLLKVYIFIKKQNC